MPKHDQSCFAGLNTNRRFEIAKQLAADYHLDVSQVLFTYLKVAEPILAKNQAANQISETAQRKIDERFEQVLTKLSQIKKG
ncbi:hypothetical protein IWT140_01784 [Secundilactobacillus pentosiphilus]|uniref:Uncharacterized protein n=1 Tax=Secundilactobacillus pentosiphilus TaxID=1714682 RepID=A0A1Z5IR43_9LACO|nr:hypothetical protein [Secundilactobacillus pentosiphilus]GAX04146.1 hypothetical protein IWT140_01784 [Secundilactobacillus pentosiphilus]